MTTVNDSTPDVQAPETTLEPDVRTAPHDLDTEQALLGLGLQSAQAVGDALERGLRSEDFYLPKHGEIWASILDVYNAGQPQDPRLVKDALEKRERFQDVGGAPYLHTLQGTHAPLAAAGEYAAKVGDCAQRRRLLETFEGLTREIYYSESGTAPSMMERAQAKVSALERTTGNDLTGLGEFIQGTIDELDAIQSGEGRSSGIPTGFADLDDVTNGLHPGQFVCVGARPGVGKTTLLMDMSRAAAIKHGQRVAFFSLEMGTSELTMRTLSAESRIRLADMRGGSMSDDDWARLGRRGNELAESGLLFDDSPNLTIEEIRAKARKEARTNGLDAIFVDYLQLLTQSTKAESRQLEVQEISRKLKLLAKELDVPVVAASQVNRGSEQRSDKKPQLADLRESGAIEQDCDVVILIHRPDAFERDDPRMGEADLMLAKHRAGPTSTVTVAHQLHYCRFVDMASEG